MENVMCILLAGLSAASASIFIGRHLKRQRLWQDGGLYHSKKGALPVADFFSAIARHIPERILKAATRYRGQKITSLIVEAGLDGWMDRNVYIAAKMVSAASGAILFLLLAPMPVCLSLPAGAAAGFFYVDIRLKAAARKRNEAIEASLSHALDWLSLSVEAGLDFAEALSRVSAKLKDGPLKSELVRLDSSMRVGEKRREALSEMKRRTNVNALKAFASMLIQADTLGTGISHVLRATAARIREERLSRAEKKGAAAAQKALLPLTFCIMPATFVIVFGPLIARLVTGGFNAMF